MISYREAGEKKIKNIIAANGITGEQADKMFSEIEDIISEIAWEAKSDGAWEADYYHVCDPG